MRCFFIRDGPIGGVEILPDLFHQEAIEQSKLLFERKRDLCHAFDALATLRAPTPKLLALAEQARDLC